MGARGTAEQQLRFSGQLHLAMTPSIVRVSNLVIGDTPTHQHQTDGTSARGKQNAHPIAVVDEAVNDPRDKEPVAFVEAHGTVVAGDH